MKKSDIELSAIFHSQVSVRILVGTLILLSSILVGTIESAQNDDVVITVDSTNLQFSPSEVTITEGQAVRFFWSGELLEHNAVSTDGIFDSGSPSRNVDFRFVFDYGTNGTYDFVCEPHELVGMIGTITVEPGEGPGLESEEPENSSAETKSEKFQLTFFGLELIMLSFLAFMIYQVGKARERGLPIFIRSQEENQD
ncbi:MAG: plastocyanin/azurin family copper-binding protein [Candidatus Thermoplasmatota archaeon]|jgi:plastocyanin|nr:plastocyanin/azurin family copper-binding protein [Candidatus Thermoplasmatota archaeon]MED5306528.1 plastocyanin/azurin family copper-binding protein [Candidatus Thermoplasmatota archaeon]|tara:strand:- start:474 stop:1064 length:591 start_codon:yes stop_codon:yes gene_type:complete